MRNVIHRRPRGTVGYQQREADAHVALGLGVLQVGGPLTLSVGRDD